MVAVLLGSRRINSIGAGCAAVATASLVATTGGPTRLGVYEIVIASMKGLWLSWLVGSVIFSGLFFREVASGLQGRSNTPQTRNTLPRKRLFVSCFLIGPFTEAATGFGVGQVATAATLRDLGLTPVSVVLLGLFSQILVPWGAMANGTVVGAAFARLSTRELGTYSAVLTAPLLLGWLLVFWRIAAGAGIAASWAERQSELLFIFLIGILLVAANRVIGPEVAAMAVLGPMIVWEFWRNESPDRQRWWSGLRFALPYMALISGLAMTRASPTLTGWLAHLVTFRPFSGSPPWSPLLHPATWLAGVGFATAVLSRRIHKVADTAATAWRHGRRAVLTIAVFLVAAGILSDSGIAAAFAQGLRRLLGTFAPVAVPALSGAFGFLTGSSNATNGLLMATQAGVAAHGDVPLVWVAALQNTAAAALTMLSPARVATGCALVGEKGIEGEVYGQAWPLAGMALVVLSAAAMVFVLAYDAGGLLARISMGVR